MRVALSHAQTRQRFKPGEMGIRLPPGIQALVPERNMDPAKDRRLEGSNPSRGTYALIAEWNRLAAQDRRIPERDVPGSNPGGRITKDCRNGRRGWLKPGFLRVRIPCPSFTHKEKGGR